MSKKRKIDDISGTKFKNVVLQKDWKNTHGTIKKAGTKLTVLQWLYDELKEHGYLDKTEKKETKTKKI